MIQNNDKIQILKEIRSEICIMKLELANIKIDQALSKIFNKAHKITLVLKKYAFQRLKLTSPKQFSIVLFQLRLKRFVDTLQKFYQRMRIKCFRKLLIFNTYNQRTRSIVEQDRRLKLEVKQITKIKFEHLRNQGSILSQNEQENLQLKLHLKKIQAMFSKFTEEAKIYLPRNKSPSIKN